MATVPGQPGVGDAPQDSQLLAYVARLEDFEFQSVSFSAGQCLAQSVALGTL